MGFDFKEVFAHLNGKTLTYAQLMDEIIRARRDHLGDLGPEINTHDLYYNLMQMGWITFPDDGTSGDNSTCNFTIREDVRVVRKRIEQYKQDFIKEQAKIFLNEEEEDGQFYPCDVNVDEYRQAVRELANS